MKHESNSNYHNKKWDELSWILEADDIAANWRKATSAKAEHRGTSRRVTRLSWLAV